MQIGKCPEKWFVDFIMFCTVTLFTWTTYLFIQSHWRLAYFFLFEVLQRLPIYTSDYKRMSIVLLESDLANAKCFLWFHSLHWEVRMFCTWQDLVLNITTPVWSTTPFISFSPLRYCLHYFWLCRTLKYQIQHFN